VTRSGVDTRTAPARDDAAEPDASDLGRDLGPGLDRNEVRLVGRVSGTPERRILPSGDEVVQLRLVVRRVTDGIDTLDVAVGPAPAAGNRPRPGQSGRRLLATAERLHDGERVEVRGELRRRWWGNGAVRQSRVEVRAHAVEASSR
jgi:single-strand DNA-binding protein